MTTRRWWDIAFAGALGVLALLAGGAADASATERIGAVATLAVMGAFYAAFGRRAFVSVAGRALEGPAADAHSSTRAASIRAASIALRSVIIVGAGVATAFNPTMAVFQAIAFPLIWSLTDSYLRAVALSGVLAVSVGIGFYLGLGGGGAALAYAAVIQGLSFAFAVALGTWITRIADEGRKQRLLFQDLAAAQDELAAMHRKAGTVTERERLAREIHDTIAQSLTSLVMLAQRSHRELAEIPDERATRATETVDLIESTARDALTEARALVASMASVTTENSTLTETITRLGERFEKETGIRVSVSVEAVAVGRELEVVLLRCTQEGLANVRKHSQARTASVSIALDGSGPEVALEVRDDGRGIGTLPSGSQPTATGFGIAGMRDRVALAGGRMDVYGGERGGTVLRVVVPGEDAVKPTVTKP
ncbi:sensor histidine kinase [Homoserinimonas sp. OAct 916]|uniref:sensor histidine kinase n=1 Tax=Homoserinimonas sp. OAct 916 TaxID=2211450 RepID=UPI000DBE52C8|nr:sensor histidine kinase [Homoserinimonas sp. OAct 916]